jgi:hypothetical protein
MSKTSKEEDQLLRILAKHDALAAFSHSHSYPARQLGESEKGANIPPKRRQGLGCRPIIAVVQVEVPAGVGAKKCTVFHGYYNFRTKRAYSKKSREDAGMAAV